MNRADAIARIADFELERLPASERAEQLECMVLESWDEPPRWREVPRDIRSEFARGELRRAPSDRRYDPVLLLWLSDRYAPATNDFLLAKLKAFGEELDTITGTPVTMETCPCCGYRTLGSRADYGICRVCWWEDDGQDSANADENMGGPNGDLSLTEARLNFLQAGIYNPEREDLRRHQEPREMYERGRIFVASAAGVEELISR